MSKDFWGEKRGEENGIEKPENEPCEIDFANEVWEKQTESEDGTWSMPIAGEVRQPSESRSSQ